MLTEYRVRGYQYKTSGPGGPKKNPAPYTSLNDGAQKTGDAPLMPDPKSDAKGLEENGFATKMGRE